MNEVAYELLRFYASAYLSAGNDHVRRAVAEASLRAACRMYYSLTHGTMVHDDVADLLALVLQAAAGDQPQGDRLGRRPTTKGGEQ